MKDEKDNWTTKKRMERKTKEKMDEFQHPSKRIGTPNDILKAILYLTEEGNDFINGQNITIDGGMSKQMIYHNDEGWKKT